MIDNEKDIMTEVGDRDLQNFIVPEVLFGFWGGESIPFISDCHPTCSLTRFEMVKTILLFARQYLHFYWEISIFSCFGGKFLICLHKRGELTSKKRIICIGLKLFMPFCIG